MMAFKCLPLALTFVIKSFTKLNTIVFECHVSDNNRKAKWNTICIQFCLHLMSAWKARMTKAYCRNILYMVPRWSQVNIDIFHLCTQHSLGIHHNNPLKHKVQKLWFLFLSSNDYANDHYDSFVFISVIKERVFQLLSNNQHQINYHHQSQR